MKILIIYGTVEGQTRKIARFMEDELQTRNHQVVIADATEEPPSPSGFDVVFIGSSIHIHRYNSTIREYVGDHVEWLNQHPSAFFSVCMAIAADIPEEHEEVKKIAQSFLDESGWRPSKIWHFAGALRYTQYDFFKRLIMKMIARQQGGATDTRSDHEYTDWEQVRDAVVSFVQPLDN